MNRVAAWTHALRTYASLVQLSHTVFGLPFALAATVLAHRHATSMGGNGLDAAALLWIVLAFTGARTAAMGFNRLVDRHIDARNPRTATRELPRGAIRTTTAWLLTAGALLVFLVAAWQLGPLPLALAPACVLVLFGYSYFKRFSWSSHLVLGTALALAPGGAWIAVTGSFSGWPVPALMMTAVATWVAGFDVIYSLQDVEFDRGAGLHSIPARFGVRGALWLSGLLHVATAAALLALHHHARLGPWHAVGVAAVCTILAYEHAIVRPSDLSRINRAFFDLNGWVSLGYLACTVLDSWLS